MVLGRLEVHCNLHDIQQIIREVKSELNKIGYKIKNSNDSLIQYQSLRIAKDNYQWILDFHMKLERTGNLVHIEITRKEFFSIDKFIADRMKHINQSGQQRTFLGSLFRFWWIFIIISFVGSLLISFLPDSSSPISMIGYFLLSVLGIFVIFYFVSGFIRSKQKKKEGEKADILTEQLKHILQSLNSDLSDTKIICWNCFSEIIPDNNKCPKCNKDIIKI